MALLKHTGCVCTYMYVFIRIWVIAALGKKIAVPLCAHSDRKESGSTLGVNRLIPYAEDRRVCALLTALFRLRLEQNASFGPCFHRHESSPLTSHVTHTPALEQPRSVRVWLFSAPTWLK